MNVKKIRSIIIDDDESNLSNLQIMLTTYCPNVEILAAASTVPQAISEILSKKPDLLFLDVEIKNSTGFDLLEQLENRNFHVIFVTAFDQYAIKALRFSAVDYLLKPISIEDLQNAVNRAQQRMMQPHPFKELENLMSNMRKGIQTPRIALPMSGSIEFVPVSNILRCVGESSYTTFHMKGGSKMVVSKTLKEYEDLLEEHNFLRVHKSHLVNLNHVKSFVKTADAHVVMDDGSTVTVSNLKKQEVLKRMSN